MKLLKYMSLRPILKAIRDDSIAEGRQSCTYVLCKHGTDNKPEIVGLQIKRKKIFSANDRKHGMNSLISRLCGIGGASHRDESRKYGNGGILADAEKFPFNLNGGMNNSGYLFTHATHIERGLFGELDVLAKVRFPLSFDSLPYGKESWRIKYID